MLGVVSLGLMQLTDQQAKGQRKLRSDLSTNSVMYKLSVVNKNGDACENTLNTVAAGGDLNTLPRNISIRDQSDRVLLTTGTVYGNGTGKVEATRVQVVQSVPPIQVTGSPQPYSLKIEMDFNNPNGNFSKTMSIGFIDNDGNGVIDFSAGDSCTVENLDVAVICEALGGVTNNQRCANIDLYNDEADSATPGESQFFGVMARGGIAITEDEGFNAVDKYWSITPTNESLSKLQFRIDDTNNPDGANLPLVSLESRNDNTNTEIIMNADEYLFRNHDATRTFFQVDSDGGVGFGGENIFASTNAILNVRAYDVLTQDAIRIQSNASANRSDIHLVQQGSIAAESNLIINVDVDNDGTGNKIFFGNNGKGMAGSNLLTIEEGGNVGIGTEDPISNLDIYSTTGNANLLLKTTNAAGNIGFRLYNGDTNWLIQNQGSADEDLFFYNESNSRLLMKISKGGGIVMRNGVPQAYNPYTQNAVGTLDVWDGHVYLYQDKDEIGNQGTGTCSGSAGETACRVVNRGWVYNWFANTTAGSMSGAQKAAIMNNLLSTSVATNWTTLRDNAEAHVFDNISVSHNSGLSGGVVCPAGQFVSRIRYVDPGSFRFDCGNPLGCGNQNNCSRVYAGSGGAGRVCIKNGGSNWDCLSHGQETWPNGCQTVTTGGGHSNDRTATCAGNRMMRNISYLSNGVISVRCCNQNILVDE